MDPTVQHYHNFEGKYDHYAQNAHMMAPHPEMINPRDLKMMQNM